MEKYGLGVSITQLTATMLNKHLEDFMVLPKFPSLVKKTLPNGLISRQAFLILSLLLVTTLLHYTNTTHTLHLRNLNLMCYVKSQGEFIWATNNA